MAFKMRPYTGQTDLSSVIDLRVAYGVAGTVDLWPGVSELQLLLEKTQDKERHTCLWEDTKGNLLAFALMLWNESHLVFFIHPQASGRDFEAQIIAWGIERAREVGRTSGEAVQLRVRPRDDEAELIALLERHGFERGDWHTLRMVRSLREPIPNPQLQQGFTIRPLAGEREVRDYVDLHREVFGTKNMTVEHRLSFMGSGAYRSDLDLVVVAPDGRLAAFCVGSFDEEENRRIGRREGWTDPIGTRPAFRRKGLARAAVLEALHRLKARGIEVAILGTGSWNMALQRLAGSVGFRTIHNILVYDKKV